MSVNKNFEYETGYFGEDGIPETVKEYMKATGKTLEEVAKEIVDSNLSNEPKQEVIEPETEVETEEVDEGPGLLKRIGLGIMDIPKSVSDWRDTHDDMWRVGLVNAMFGDNSTLNNWYANQNAMKEAEKNREFQAEQARLNRESQQEYNTMFKQLEEANQRKEQIAVDRKRALEILDKGESASPVEKLELEQILGNYENDELKLSDLQERAGAESAKRKESEAKAEEERLLKEEEDRKKAVVAESFIAQIPGSFKNDASKKSWIANHKQEIEELPIEYQQRAWSKLGGQTQSEKDRETYHAAGIQQGIQESNEKKQARSRYNELKNKAFRTLAETSEMNSLKSKYGF